MLSKVFKDQPNTLVNIHKMRVLLTYNDSPMNSIGVKFKLDEGVLSLVILPLREVGTQKVLHNADEIPPNLYTLGSIVSTRFKSWKNTGNEPLSVVFRDIRDCAIEEFSHESS